MRVHAHLRARPWWRPRAVRTPGPPRRASLRTAAIQAALIGGAAVAYFGVRHLTEGSTALAVENARSVLAVERTLGVRVEDSLQDWIVPSEWLRTPTNWIYTWGHWPVLAIALLWLHVRRPHAFRTLRNAMFISGAIGLVVFATFPVAPPRLAGIGAVDTVTLHSSSYRALQPPGFVNQYAAMPSLHFGWNLILGLLLVREVRSPGARAFAVVMPVAMAFAVVATANHFVLDVPAGGIVALAGLALVPWVDAVIASTRRRWVDP